MKAMYLLTLFLLITSCSTHRLNTQIEKSDSDLLSGESMLRYSENRLERIEKHKNSLIAAVSLCYQKEYSEGLDKLKQNIKGNIENPSYWNHVGTCYYLEDKLEKAEYYFKLALNTAKKQKREFAVAENNLGLIQLRLRHYDKALELFKKAEKSGILTPRFNKLQLYLQFGQLTKAKELAFQLQNINDKDVDVIVALATIYMLEGKYKTSERYFKRIPEKFLDREDISGSYAIVQYHLGKYEEAKLTLQKGQYTQIRTIKNMRKNLKLLIERELERLKEEQDAKRLKTGKRGSRAG
jgi:tetratricopeptide (TPR) repeat protein